MTVDFKRYEKFIGTVIQVVQGIVYLADRLVELDRKGANIERLTTSGVGPCC